MSHLATPGPLRVVSWHAALYRRLWRVNVLSSLVQPLVYMLGLGVGVGTLVDRNTASGDLLGGGSYVAFVAPGLLVTTTMVLASGESMWPVMAGLRWSRGYHGIAATPLAATDIVLGHALWTTVRSLIATGAVACVLALFPDTRSWGLVPAVVAAAFVGLAFAMPLMAYSIDAEMDGGFPAIQRFVITPLFLFGGAFYPVTLLPAAVEWVAKAAPLWHGVTVARAFTTPGGPPIDWPAVAGHLGYTLLFTVAGTLVAVRRLRRRLYP